MRRRGGWRRRGGILEAYVRLYRGPGGLRTKHFALTTPPAEIQHWIGDTDLAYSRQHPTCTPGALSADADTYVKLLVNRPALQRERARQLAWWCEHFGTRSRPSLEAVELETALNELIAAGAAPSTVKKYRTALYHLFTKLDGKNAPNPLRDVAPPKEPDPEPRWIPYPIIDAILEAMPDRGQGLRHQPRPTVSKTKARLRVIAYTGIPHAQVMQIREGDLNWAEPSVLVRARKKGGGTRARRLPLTPDGVAAFQAFAAADAWGAFSPSSARQSWIRGIDRLCTGLETRDETRELGTQLREQLRGVRPYDLRHSYLTEAQLASGNIHATQGLAMHADARMTHRYTLAAVAPELKAAAELLAARFATTILQPTNQPTNRLEGSAKTLRNLGNRKVLRMPDLRRRQEQKV